jgi:tetratricopeptide (TPR) repeat protein
VRLALEILAGLAVLLFLAAPYLNRFMARANLRAFAARASRAYDAGDREAMLKACREALAFCEQFKIEGAELGGVLLQLGLALTTRAKWDEAGPTLERAVKVLEAAPDASVDRLVEAIDGLAMFQYFMGRFAESEASQRRALAAVARSPSAALRATRKHRLAFILVERERQAREPGDLSSLDEAERLLADSLQARELPGGFEERVANEMIRAADVCLERGDEVRRKRLLARVPGSALASDAVRRAFEQVEQGIALP